MKRNIFLPIILVTFSIVISLLAGCVGQRGQLYIPPSLEPAELERQILENYEGQYYVDGNMGRGIWGGHWPRGFYSHKFGTLGKKEPSGDGVDVVLNMDIFKYKNPTLAEEDYLEFSRVDKLSDLDYHGINLKGKQEVRPWNSTYQCYLILSDSFIIRINGEEDIARDVLDTVIGKFG